MRNRLACNVNGLSLIAAVFILLNAGPANAVLGEFQTCTDDQPTISIDDNPQVDPGAVWENYMGGGHHYGDGCSNNGDFAYGVYWTPCWQYWGTWNIGACSDAGCGLPIEIRTKDPFYYSAATSAVKIATWGGPDIEYSVASEYASCDLGGIGIVENISMPPLDEPLEKITYTYHPGTDKKDKKLLCHPAYKVRPAQIYGTAGVRCPQSTELEMNLVRAVAVNRHATPCVGYGANDRCLTYGYCVFKIETCTTLCEDTDGDGVFAYSEMCPEGTDCEPTNPNVTVCECETGKQRKCFTGPWMAQDIGSCKSGVQNCVNGKWETACTGESLPQKEVCDGADNDCNGVPDDDCACPVSCYDGPAGTKNIAPCKEGVRACTNGQYGDCEDQVLPQPEVCGDGIDNDCNEKTSDICPLPADICPKSDGSTSGQ